jgi:hypothetical protein
MRWVPYRCERVRPKMDVFHLGLQQYLGINRLKVSRLCLGHHDLRSENARVGITGDRRAAVDQRALEWESLLVILLICTRSASVRKLSGGRLKTFAAA